MDPPTLAGRAAPLCRRAATTRPPPSARSGATSSAQLDALGVPGAPTPDSPHTLVASVSAAGGWHTGRPVPAHPRLRRGAARLRPPRLSRAAGASSPRWSSGATSAGPTRSSSTSAPWPSWTWGRSGRATPPSAWTRRCGRTSASGCACAFPPGSRQTFRVDVGVPLHAGHRLPQRRGLGGVGQLIGSRTEQRDPQLGRSTRQGISPRHLRLPARSRDARAPALYRAAWVLPVASPPISGTARCWWTPTGASRRWARGRPCRRRRARTWWSWARPRSSPGWSNVHAHPELAMFRGALEDLPFRDWILRLVGAQARARCATRTIPWAARWTALEALRAGMTTLGATETSGAALRRLPRGRAARDRLPGGVRARPRRSAEASMRGLRAALDRLRARETDLVRVGISPARPLHRLRRPLPRGRARWRASEGLPDGGAHRRVRGRARASCARARATSRRGCAPAASPPRRAAAPPSRCSTAWACWRRARSSSTAWTWTTTDVRAHRRRAAARWRTAPSPTRGWATASRRCRELREAGVRVGLGTDSVGSNNRLDLLEEARVASLLQRDAAARPLDSSPPPSSCASAPLEGARALGLDDRDRDAGAGEGRGPLRRLPRRRRTPAPCTTRSPPSSTPRAPPTWSSRWCAGRVLYRDGEVLSLDCRRDRGRGRGGRRPADGRPGDRPRRASARPERMDSPSRTRRSWAAASPTCAG